MSLADSKTPTFFLSFLPLPLHPRGIIVMGEGSWERCLPPGSPRSESLRRALGETSRTGVCEVTQKRSRAISYKPCFLASFLKIYFDYAITVVPFFFSPLFPSILHSPLFMSMGHTYTFFGFSIPYTIPNLPLSILYLPFMLPIPCTFSPILPLITLHVISTSVILFLF